MSWKIVKKLKSWRYMGDREKRRAVWPGEAVLSCGYSLAGPVRGLHL